MKRSSLYTVIFCLLLAGTSCMQKALPPQALSTPEFMHVKCYIRGYGSESTAVLTAVLNSNNGIETSGFMFGKDEVSMKFISTPMVDYSFSTEISELEPGSYVYFATVSNGRNTIRTKMSGFVIEKSNDSAIITPPDSGYDDNPSGGNDGKDDSTIVTPPGEGDDPDEGGDNTHDGDGKPDSGDDNSSGGDDNTSGSGDKPGSGDDNTSGGDDDSSSGDDDTSGGGSGEGNDDNKPLPPPEDTDLPISDDNFRTYLLNRFDSDRNGVLTKAEAESAKNIDVCTDDIRTLDGIAYFTNLEKLLCKGSTSLGSLTALMLGDNGKLKVLDCSYNHIKKLMIPLSITELNCRYNELREVYFPKCPNLRKLDIFGNYISSLDISKLSELEDLTCGMNSFTTLDTSKNLKLKKLDCSDSPMLEVIYVSRAHRIDEIIAENSVRIEYID